MLIKTIFVFLLAMAAVGMIGNALTKGGITRSAKKRLGLRPATRCRRCGRYVIGTTGCDCDKKG
ncbi:hypothetical protein MASR2M74_23930 [Paracoccaceae bacterium]